MTTKKIIIVEDEYIIALDVASNVESMGHIVVGMVDNGEEAIALTTEQNPDLLMMDINIKGEMTGIDAFRQIRQTAAIPVIFLTGYQCPPILQEKLGVKMEYISKPFEPEDLRLVVERIISSGTLSERSVMDLEHSVDI